jgi:hypothetical protein
MAGGCGAAGTLVCMGCPWKTCTRIIYHQEGNKCYLINDPSSLSPEKKNKNKEERKYKAVITINNSFKDK